MTSSFPEKKSESIARQLSFPLYGFVEIFIYDEVFSRKNSNSIARTIFRFRYSFAEIFIYDKVFSRKFLKSIAWQLPFPL